MVALVVVRVEVEVGVRVVVVVADVVVEVVVVSKGFIVLVCCIVRVSFALRDAEIAMERDCVGVGLRHAVPLQ